MAKKKTAKKNGPNKSQAIRDAMAKMPSASANEIAEAASKATGQTVTAALVYNVKANNGHKEEKEEGHEGSGGTCCCERWSERFTHQGSCCILAACGGDAKTAQQALSVATDVSKMFAK